MIELHTVGKNEKLTNPSDSVSSMGLGATLADSQSKDIRSTARAKTTCMTARKNKSILFYKHDHCPKQKELEPENQSNDRTNHPQLPKDPWTTSVDRAIRIPNEP